LILPFFCPESFRNAPRIVTPIARCQFSPSVSFSVLLSLLYFFFRYAFLFPIQLCACLSRGVLHSKCKPASRRSILSQHREMYVSSIKFFYVKPPPPSIKLLTTRVSHVPPEDPTAVSLVAGTFSPRRSSPPSPFFRCFFSVRITVFFSSVPPRPSVQVFSVVF